MMVNFTKLLLWTRVSW